jgi:hypothetical protein
MSLIDTARVGRVDHRVALAFCCTQWPSSASPGSHPSPIPLRLSPQPEPVQLAVRPQSPTSKPSPTREEKPHFFSELPPDRKDVASGQGGLPEQRDESRRDLSPAVTPGCHACKAKAMPPWWRSSPRRFITPSRLQHHRPSPPPTTTAALLAGSLHAPIPRPRRRPRARQDRRRQHSVAMPPRRHRRSGLAAGHSGTLRHASGGRWTTPMAMLRSRAT